MAPAVYAPQAETEHFLPPMPRTPAHTAVTPAISHRDEPPRRSRAWIWVTLALLAIAAVIAALIVVPKLTADDPVPTTEVPNIRNMTLDEARSALEEHGLVLGEETTTNAGRKNHIVRQDPAPGETVDEGTAVDYTISVGPETEVVPPGLDDLSLDAATDQLEDLGFQVDPQEDPTSTERKNQVTRVDPPSGTTQPVGTVITVYYSPGYVEVPSVVGLTQEDATGQLEAEGFVVVPSMVQSETDAGTVTAQDPAGETRQPYGSTVVISVSLGPTEPPPDTTSSDTTDPGDDG